MMFLTSALILPVGMSYAITANDTVGANQTLSTNAIVTVSKNQTVSTTTVNQTSSPSPVSQNNVNDTSEAQKISAFIHQATADFKQQGVDTHKAMLDCRDNLQKASPADVSKVRADCTTQLSSIKAKYQDERKQFHDLVKQYRQSVMVFLMDARGATVDKSVMDKAITNLSMMMNMPSGGMTGHVPGMMATTNNTNCVNASGGIPNGRC